ITTSAVNENRRPPLTTLATRLISTTRSFSSRVSSRAITSRSTELLNVHLPTRSCSRAAKSKPRKDAGSARSRRLRARLRTRRGAALQRARGRERGGRGTSLKAQSPFARAVCQRLHASVVEVPAAVEHSLLDSGLLRVLGQQLPDLARLLRLVAAERLLHVQPRRGRERLARDVVDQLRLDAAVRAEHGETRPLGRALHLAANALVTADARLADGENRTHAATLDPRAPGQQRRRPHSQATP